MHFGNGKSGRIGRIMKNSKHTPIAVVLVVWLVAFGIVGEVWGIDFSVLSKPGFGTEEGVCPGGCTPRIRDSGSLRNVPQISNTQEAEKKRVKLERERKRNERLILEAARRQKKALIALRKEIAVIEPSKADTPYYAEHIPSGEERKLASAVSLIFGTRGITGYDVHIPIGKTLPTKIPSENLLRAISILAAIPKNKTSKDMDCMHLWDTSCEDAKFLGVQAGLAMINAPLEVVVPSVSQSSLRRSRQIDRLLQIIKKTERTVIQLGGIWDKSRELEIEIAEKKEQMGTDHNPKNEKYWKNKGEYDELINQLDLVSQMKGDWDRRLKKQQETVQKELTVVIEMVP